MPLDPALKAMLDAMSTNDGATITQMSPVEARQMMRALALADGEPEPVADIADATIAGVPVRVYRPDGAPAAGAPCLAWIHGGGFVIGDLETADTTSRKLANRTGAVVISVDYRLAPEHPFPAAPDDCLAVLRSLVSEPEQVGIDASRIAVGGDSAGGNLSAVSAISARDEGIALRHQLLVYPVTDLTMSFPSIEENGEGYLLTAESMRWFHDHYVGTSASDAKDPRVSPYWADDVSAVAPATVITAEFDPLRDEGNAYAERLREAGVAVEHRQFDGQIHGFFALAGITAATNEAVDWAAGNVKRALA